MEKLNDYFLNLLNNPTFGANEFSLVGLSIDNTSLLNKDIYLNSSYIKDLDIFKTNGEFDLSKFDNFYEYAKKGITDLASIKESEDIGNTWKAYRNDISMPEYLRDNRPQFKIEKVKNPLRQQSGFVNYGLKENPTLSIREIAQGQLLLDYETGELKESPNDTWWDNFINPKVLATWDEDGTHEDPITGEIVQHKKGDKKLNKNGTFYYENLGNRSIYGKEVLSGFDTLTTDGSAWNKLDFLDSDDIEKSFRGSLMRAAAQIVPAFIPYVNTWYIGARVGLGMSQILPAVGKTLESLTGINTENSIFNRLEAWDKALTFSQSDYTQGSLTDDGLILSDSHLWSWETGFKLVADVFTQLAELRWMFEKSTQLFSGLSKDVVSSKKAQTEWIENYIKNNTKGENLDEILMNGISKGVDPITTKRTMDAVNWARAQRVLESKLKGAQDLGSKLSMAYMTGITTASSYGEAKEAGATDLEAALYTLGYTFGEWKLLNSELGKWILPELKSEERHIRNVVNKVMPKIKKISSEANTNSEIGKAKWYLKLFNIGKNAYYNNLGQGIGSEAIGATVSNMASEALEETSEELLQDFAKTIFNAGTSLVGSDAKFDDAFENIFDRYALSFVGGAVGGGIAGYLPAYRSARFDRRMSQEAATKELVDIIQQGKENLLISTVNKMTFGNAYLDEQGNQVDDKTKSLDFQIKKNFSRLVQDIKDILTVNGANLSQDSLLKELGTEDIRYGMLASLAAEKSNAIEWYLNRYNDLSSQLVAKSLELKGLEEKQTDKEKREGNNDNSEKEKSLKENIKNIKDELDKFKDGTMSDEFILDALFEMTSKISGVYIPTLEQTIKEETGKDIDQLTDAEREAWSEEFNAQRPVRRNLVRMARMIHIQNMEKLADMLTLYNETYFKNPDEAINNLNEILFEHRQNVIDSPDIAVPLAEGFLAIYLDRINPMLSQLQEAILSNLDESIAKPFKDRIKAIMDSPSTLAKLIGINTLPTTVTELRALDEDTKKKLLSAFGIDSYSSVDEILNDDYIETTELNGELVEVLNSKFKKSVKNYENTLRSDLNALFNTVLRDFLLNKEVKQALINKFKLAKFILPTVKQALTDFFTATVPMLDEESYQYVPEPLIPKDLALEYIDSFKDKQSSPVDLYINNIVTTLKGQGIEISPLVANIDELVSKLAKAKNLEIFSYTDEVEKTINDALKILQYAKVGLDSAATTINGDLSDAFGYNVSVNEIRTRRGNSSQELATIPADVAEGIILDINRYEQDLLFFKSLQAFNSNSILNEHDKTYRVLSLNLYNKLKNFVGHLETPDWNDIDKLKLALEDSSISEIFEDIESLGNDLESKEKLTEARLKIDNAVHTFFKANEDKIRGFKTKEDRDNAIKLLLKLLNDLKVTYNPIKDSNTVINAEEKSLPDKDLLWYLASMAAADPEAVLNEYSEVISGQYAPIIGLEEAIRTSLSFLIDPKVFDLFADAYNANVLASNYDKKAHIIVNAKRSIFIEGVPGSGKSSATLKTLTDILDKYHPNLLKNVVIVSNSKENSKRLVETLGMDSTKVQHFGIEEFRNKIMNNYRPLDTDENGSLKVKDGKEVEYDPEKHTNVYKEFTLNTEGLDASLIIVDEATSLSQMDAAMLDDFMEAKSIYGVYAGDFDQLGVSGKMESSKGTYLITQDITNYISTHKLGQVIRGNNSYKSNNVIGLKIQRAEFIDSLFLNGKLEPVNFSYYFDNTGVYGDVIAKADKLIDSSGTKYSLDLGTKDIIDTMINSLNEGEKINYIYDDPDSEMYKYLHDKYANKINEISTKAAQSLEGQYYIVDVELKDNLVKDSNSPDLIKAVNQFKTLYTALSRAKLATLVYDRGSNNETISKRLNSTRIDKLITTNIGQEARLKYVDGRKTAIKKALNGNEKTLDNDWNEYQFTEKPENPITENKDDEDDSNEEETADSKIDARNEPREININNDAEDSLNMMIHSFNTHEVGGIIDENGLLILGERGTRINSKGEYIGERIDNANGIVKTLKLPIDNEGKLSAEDTLKVLTILHKIRTAGLYEKSNGNIIAAIKDALDLGSSSNVSVRFIYKNSQEADTLTSRGPLSKFFNTVKEKLLYLFNGETDLNKKDKQETCPNRTIGLEIFVDGLQIEIPIGVFTSPATLVKTKGFEKLNEIYILAGERLTEFEKLLRIKKLNGENIPHLSSMLKLLEVYQWNYNNKTGKLNFVIRFDKNFTLNSDSSRLTGVQTPPRERGKDYKDLDYWYPGRRLSLEDYRREMPNRKISNVYENLDEDIKDTEGRVVLEHGIPFILVSDYYTDVNDRDLYKEYIKQITTPNSEPKITAVYVYIPTESLDYFLYNLQEALKKDPNARASDLDGTTGNKLTTYRLLSFMLLDNSKFVTTYLDWLKKLNFSQEQIELSEKRLHRMQDLLKYISNYESTLVPSFTEGSQSKQILQFLDKTPENLRLNHSLLIDIIAGNDSQGWIGNMKLSLRTTLLLEFRKLLYSNLFYEGINPEDAIKFPSPNLGSLNFEIIKNGENDYRYQDYQKDRIEALKEDASRNGWDGVMFHTSLEKDSEMVVSQGSNSYRVAAIQNLDATYISSRPIELNGKLDTTAVIMGVEPMLDEILSKLVATKDGSVCSSTLLSFSDNARQKIYEENTGAYLKGENPDEIIDLDKELLNKTLNAIEPNPELPMDIVTQTLKNFINREGSNYTVEGLLNLAFYNTGHAIIKVGSNYKIVPLPENVERLVILPNETYYMHNGTIYKASDKTSVNEVNELLLLLTNGVGLLRDSSRIILEYINNLSAADPQNETNGQQLLDNIYAPGFINFLDLLNYDNDANEDTLIKIGALEIDPERKYNSVRYLLNYVLKISGDKTALKEFRRNAKSMSDLNIMIVLQLYTQNLDSLTKLLDLLDNILNPKIDECTSVDV